VQLHAWSRAALGHCAQRLWQQLKIRPVAPTLWNGRCPANNGQFAPSSKRYTVNSSELHCFGCFIHIHIFSFLFMHTRIFIFISFQNQ
jgi:hypothetical protein